jgi:hypothetical protein
MKTSEMLEKAKKYLWDGVETNSPKDAPICCALRKSCGAVQPKGIREEICKRLRPYNDVHSWLYYNPSVDREDMTDQTVQSHRLAWMNLLIKEYKAKGD